jgi:ribosomal protein S18 acetylase RimI-like enzyme
MTTTSDVELRPAHRGDAESLARIHAESWKQTYRGMMSDEFLDGGALENRRRVWRERLGAPPAQQYTCVAQSGPTIVGFVCAFSDEDPEWGSYIDNLHVAHGMHRRGVGRLLMHATAKWLGRVCADRGLYLWVMEANASARAFYERLGATNAGTVDKIDPGGGRAPNCRYIWTRPQVLLARSQPEGRR